MKYFTKEYYFANRNVCHEELEPTMKAYLDYLDDLVAHLPKEFEYARKYMHECKICSMGFEDGNFVMRLDPRGTHTDVEKLVFVNANIIRNDEPIGDMYYWQDDEIYVTGDSKYEIHLLALDRTCEIPMELILVADNVLTEKCDWFGPCIKLHFGENFDPTSIQSMPE